MKRIVVIAVTAAFLFMGCASAAVTEEYTKPGTHYLKAPDKEAVEKTGNVVGLIEGVLVGFAAGAIAGMSTNNAVYGGQSAAAWMSVGGLVLAVPGGIIGWNIPYGIIGMPSEEDAKKERKKKTEEKSRNLFKDKAE